MSRVSIFGEFLLDIGRAIPLGTKKSLQSVYSMQFFNHPLRLVRNVYQLP